MVYFENAFHCYFIHHNLPLRRGTDTIAVCSENHTKHLKHSLPKLKPYINFNKCPAHYQNHPQKITNIDTYVFGDSFYLTAVFPPCNDCLWSRTRRSTFHIVTFIGRHLLVFSRYVHCDRFHCQ
jgi:hypothetical protein